MRGVGRVPQILPRSMSKDEIPRTIAQTMLQGILDNMQKEMEKGKQEVEIKILTKVVDLIFKMPPLLTVD